MPAEIQQRLTAIHPRRRLSGPTAVANPALFLASTASSWLAGLTIDVPQQLLYRCGSSPIVPVHIPLVFLVRISESAFSLVAALRATVARSRAPGVTLRQPIEPMRADSVTDLPNHGGRRLAYEPKWDGWRCIAWIAADQVMLHSRQGKNLTPYFPDIVRHLNALPQGVVLDGELIIWDAGRSRTSFAALQRRVTAGRGLAREAAEHPAYFVAFDLLADAGGESMLDQPLVQRRARMTRLLAASPPQLLSCPQTLDVAEARRWLREWAAAGVEGLVIKDLAGRYTPGKAGWFKFKTRSTTEAIIGGITGSATNPTSLLLGRFDATGRLRYVAQTHPLPTAQRHALVGLLPPLALQAAADHKHPWPHPLPAAWSGQLDDRQPLPYVQVQPVIVAEVETDAAYDPEHGRWRHRARYIRLRSDLAAHDVPPLAA